MQSTSLFRHIFALLGIITAGPLIGTGTLLTLSFLMRAAGVSMSASGLHAISMLALLVGLVACVNRVGLAIFHPDPTAWRQDWLRPAVIIGMLYLIPLIGFSILGELPMILGGNAIVTP